MRFFTNPLTAILLLFSCTLLAQGTVSGELRKWHTVSITFNGPNTSENNATNPFLDYRLNVTFTSPSGNTFLVPGFYAADGNASETSANSGNKWMVRFSPNETGQWSYSASFRTGNNVAINSSQNAGSTTSFDGASGNFSISGTNKSAPDNRAKGRLNYVGKRYLRFEETGKYFIKAGADSPENLLGYGQFDNTVNSKNWGPHQQDWNSGDPSWKNGKGKGLIGAINYLSSKGMNAFSFLTMNVIGDGKDVWPWTATSHNALDGNSSSDSDNRTRYDVSKLEQWEILFSHAESKGLFLHFKTQETENDQLLDGGELGTERKLYYRELIARFGHHLSLNWNLGEEHDLYSADELNDTNNSRVKAYAAYFKNLDPYRHHVVIHSYPWGQDELYTPLLGNTDLTGASLQTHIDDVHADAKKWLIASKNAGKQWVLANDEQGGANKGVTADADYNGDKGNQADNRKDTRHKVLWGTLMAGGMGVEYYFGYQTGETDLTAEDWRSRDTKWEDAKIAIDFFQQHLPYWNMDTADGLTSDNDDYCFADTGNIYAIYLPNGGTTNLNLSGVSGTFAVKWFNPRSGGGLVNGSKAEITGGGNRGIGNPPNSASQDWVAVISLGENSGGGSGSGGGNCSADFEEQNGLVIIEAESIDTPGGWSKNSGAAGYTGSGYLEWEGGDSFNTPGNGTTTTKIKINDPGTYRFQWRNKVGLGNNSTEHNDSWLRFPDAADFYGQKNSNIVYPKGSGKTPTAAGAGSNGWFKIYLSGSTNWTWSTKTSDHDPHDVYVVFDSPGIYTMELSGRSDHHLIDRISLSKSGNATDLSLNETPCDSSGNQNVSVESITVSPGTGTVEIGNTLKLNVTVLPADATNKNVSWSSSDTQIATVNQNGRITAKAEGTVTITATAEDGNFTDSSNIVIVEADNGDGTDPDPDPDPDCDADFSEKDNLVVIETEHMNLVEGWELKSSANGFSGTGYLEWLGGDSFGTPGNGIISTSIKITNPGTYLFQWRSKVGEGSDSTESNDSWLRFPDASDFYGQKGNHIVYPKGSGKTPTPNGSGSDGWFKVYLGGTTNWTWSTSTSDDDPHKIYVTFDTPGIYTMEISGRSNHHLIDRIVLSQDTNNATDLSLEETPCENDTPADIAVEGILISPDQATISIEETLKLISEISPANASNKDVSWSSSDKSIATVSQNGLVSAVSEGSVVITATTSDGDFIATAIITVVDNDPQPEGPSLKIENSSAVEGRNLEFEVRLTEESDETIVMDIALLDDTANSLDYVGFVKTLTFKPGETSKTISVPTKNDNTEEENETIKVAVAEIKSGTVVDFSDTGIGTIIDEDAPLDVFPNPARANSSVQLDGMQSGIYELGLFSVSGHLVQKETITVTSGPYQFVLNSLTRGLYILRVTNLERSYTAKVMVQ